MRSFHVLGKKIIGVGSNYACHAKEMGVTIPKEPIFFLKPTSSYVLEPHPIRIPSNTEVHHEVEVGVVIRKAGANVSLDMVDNYIAGYCLAIDVTARDIQTEAKEKGQPWTIAKGMDTFCPIGTYLSKSMISDHQNIDFWLKVNGQLRQKANTKDMIIPINELIVRISKYMRFDPGTPAGVGPIKEGDVIEAGMCHDLVNMRYRVARKPIKLHN